MRRILTIRIGEALRKAVEERAHAQGKTVSALAREILQNALDERPLELRGAQLRGRLQLRQLGAESWKEALRERNCRS